jgi:hypothetical protein
MLEICRMCWTCSMRDETMDRGSKDALFWLLMVFDKDG